MNKSKFLIKFLWLVLVFTYTAEAQNTKQKSVKDTSQTDVTAADSVLKSDKLDSKLMARAMPYNIYLPNDYESDKNKEKHYPVLYLLHGLTGHYDNWAKNTKLSQYAVNSGIIIVMPEGDNGWYSDSVSVPNDKYESYIIQELIPEIDKKYRTLSNRSHRAVAGLSMGGYGSIKFGLKHPEMFVLVGSFSGALQAASLNEKMLGTSWKALTDSIMSVYGADDSATRRENDIFKIIRDLPPDKVSSLPFIYSDCGTEDGLIVTNREFSALLLEKKVPHEFRELPGVHDWNFWNAEIVEFLEVSEKFIK